MLCSGPDSACGSARRLYGGVQKALEIGLVDGRLAGCHMIQPPLPHPLLQAADHDVNWRIGMSGTSTVTG